MILESRSRDYVEARIRAGVLEHGVAELFDERRRRRADAPRRARPHGRRAPVRARAAPDRVRRAHRQDDRRLRPDGDRQGPDRGAARERPAARFEVADVSLHDLDGERPRDPLRARGRRAGARPATSSPAATASTASRRPSIPPGVLREFHREYPYGWLGILAAVAAVDDELIYAHGERGFALLSMRSPELSRLYLQCAPDEDLDAWSDERIWEELQARLGVEGWTLARGADRREGRHADAELRRRADAVGAAVPRRRRGAHRPADGREGAQPRDPRRARARRRARRVVPRRRPHARSTRTRRRACAASGAPSTSRGG